MLERGPAFSLRIRATQRGCATVFVRHHHFEVGAPVTFDEDDPHIAALEYVLGAVGADLVNGLAAAARAKHVTLDHAEALVRADLDDALATLGVVGATGHPGLSRVQVKVYASGDEEALQALWSQTLSRSPLVHTLKRAVDLDAILELTP